MKNIVIFLLLICTQLAFADKKIEVVSQVRDTYPSLSPDGTKIVFQSNRRGTNQVWLMNRDGSDARPLTDAVGDGAETPMWSPDGSAIVYASYVAKGNNDVFVMSADGGDQTRLTQGPGYDGHPHWSADGERIVFNSDRDTPDRDASWSDRWHDIWSMRPDGSDLVKHTRCEAVCTYGSLSPDNRHVLYRRVDSAPGINWSMEAIEKNSEIYVARSDGSDARNLSAHPAFDGWPLWSPDGNWIVFASNRSGPARTGHLWLIRPDATKLTQLTSGKWGFAQPAWSADSRAVFAYRFIETADWETGGIAIVSLPPGPTQ